MMPKFLVISYDSDEQQCFWDWVLAEDADGAREKVEACRDYATVVDVLDSDARHVVENFLQATDAVIEAGWRELLEAHDKCPDCGVDGYESHYCEEAQEERGPLV